MENDDGSVDVDGEGFDESEGDSQSENDDNSTDTENVNNQSEEGSEKADADAAGSEGESENKQDQKTDKGTKLDPDPLSQAHQLRANAEAKAKQYEDFLNDPKRVKAYLKELEEEKGETDIDSATIAGLDPDKLETPEDVRKFAKALKEETRKEIEKVKKELTGLTSSQQLRDTGNRIQGEISQVQTKFPELREFNSDGTKNPQFNKELENLVGDTYESLDFDKKTGQFRGNVSVMAIAEKIMGAKRIGEGSGSRKAQTDVIDKRNGRVTTSRTNTSTQTTDESTMSPASTIADRMRRAAAKR